MKYRIAWRSLLTGYEGHGQYLFDEATAREIARCANLEWTGIATHWIEAEGGE